MRTYLFFIHCVSDNMDMNMDVFFSGDYYVPVILLCNTTVQSYGDSSKGHLIFIANISIYSQYPIEKSMLV